MAQDLTGAEDNRCPGLNVMVTDKMHAALAAVKHQTVLVAVETQGAEFDGCFQVAPKIAAPVKPYHPGFQSLKAVARVFRLLVHPIDGAR